MSHKVNESFKTQKDKIQAVGRIEKTDDSNQPKVLIHHKPMYFNNTELTEETLLKTDQHFADIYQGCIDEVLSGVVKVNDQEKYFAENKRRKEESLKGNKRTIFTYLQRAYWIQTGDMIALLP